MAQKNLTRGAVLALALAGTVEARAQRGAQADLDEKEISSYRLTMEALNKVTVAMRALSAEFKKDPKLQPFLKLSADIKAVETQIKAVEAEREALDSTISALESKEEPTEADGKKLEALQAKGEQLGSKKEELDASKERLSTSMERLSESLMGSKDLGEAQTLAEMEREMLRIPHLDAALRTAGLTPREYTKLWFALFQASTVAGFKKAGALKEMPKGVSQENVRFVETHAAEIEAWQREWEALGFSTK